MKTENVKEKILKYLTIYWTMFKIGITTFGGGYAMVAIIDRELGDRKKWIEKEELLNYIAISQITPGVIAVNVSTFVGRKKGGVPGAICATLGVITPSIIIIMLIAALLTNFAGNEYVKHAFAGIRVCVCVLIINATIGFIKKTVIDLLTIAIFVGVFVVAAFTRIETVYIVLAVIVLSVIYTLIKGNKKPPESLTEQAEKSSRKGGTS
ncbi:MAG: chromate transporter [Parasporobacterium sp.]|nr:chromate transporter [Parasporobacterium sp.]